MLVDEENYSSVAEISPLKEKEGVWGQKFCTHALLLWVRMHLPILEQVDMP